MMRLPFSEFLSCLLQKYEQMFVKVLTNRKTVV